MESSPPEEATLDIPRAWIVRFATISLGLAAAAAIAVAAQNTTEPRSAPAAAPVAPQELASAHSGALRRPDPSIPVVRAVRSRPIFDADMKAELQRDIRESLRESLRAEISKHAAP